MLCHKYARNDTKRSFLKIQNNWLLSNTDLRGEGGGGAICGLHKYMLPSSRVCFPEKLRWCYMGRFATTIFSATQRCNIVATLFRIAPASFQHCNAWSAKNRPWKSLGLIKKLISCLKNWSFVFDRLRAVSLFSWSVEQNVRDTQMTTHVTKGARREALLGLPPSFLASRVFAAQRSGARARVHSRTKSEEKERLLAVYVFDSLYGIG